jgi:large subunit ribosomal protein L35e
MAKIKAHELRDKSKSDLINQLKELKSELGALRVAKVTGGAPNKLSKIKSVRKNIARVQTVYRQNQLKALKSTIEADAKNKNGKMYLPVDMRVKKTRAIRRRLTKEQAKKKTEKQAKKIAAFPVRKFALKA